MLTIPPLEKTISRSRSSKMRNTNAITNSSSSVIRIETRADRNGYGIVYHPSDCGGGDDYLNIRFYGGGGANGYPGSTCSDWGVDRPFRKFIWYANTPGNYDNNYNGSGHNWSVVDLDSKNIAAILKWNGWCDNIFCKPSENQNPASYLPPFSY